MWMGKEMSKKRKDIGVWKLWFAWYPVRTTEGDLAWFRWIARRRNW